MILTMSPNYGSKMAKSFLTEEKKKSSEGQSMARGLIQGSETGFVLIGFSHLYFEMRKFR